MNAIKSQLPFWFLVTLLAGIVIGLSIGNYMDRNAKADSVKLGSVIIHGVPYSLVEIKK